MKVLVTEPLAEEGLERLRAEPSIELQVQIEPKPEQLLSLLADVDGLIVRSKTKVTAEVLAQAKKLRIVGRAGTGVDNIDLAAATAKGVVVVNTPGGNAVSVAELAIGLILSCARNIALTDRKLKGGIWAKKEAKGNELNGKTLGIIGLGRIGREVAMRARAFGMQIVGFDPFVAESDLGEQGIRLVALDLLLEKSHVISVHVPLTEKTKNILGAPQIALMRSGVILINTARGGLIDEQALLDGLRSGKVGAAGLDVFATEPDPPKELVAHDKVVSTPHIGASTVEAQEQVGYDVAVSVADYLTRGILKSAVNYQSVSPEEMSALAPFLTLSSRLSAFASQIAVGRMQAVTVTYFGLLARARFSVLTDRIVCEALRPFLDEVDVNPINARSLAKGRGLQVTEASAQIGDGLSAGIRIQLTTDQGSVEVEGTSLGGGRAPRLVCLDKVEIDTPLEGPTLFFRNDDVPGVIGHLGTFAAERGINIANFALRKDGRGGAIGVVQLDQRMTKPHRDELRKVPGIRFVRSLDLP